MMIASQLFNPVVLTGSLFTDVADTLNFQVLCFEKNNNNSVLTFTNSTKIFCRLFPDLYRLTIHCWTSLFIYYFIYFYIFFNIKGGNSRARNKSRNKKAR